jgi:hypothetical protein
VAAQSRRHTRVAADVSELAFDIVSGIELAARVPALQRLVRIAHDGLDAPDISLSLRLLGDEDRVADSAGGDLGPGLSNDLDRFVDTER